MIIFKQLIEAIQKSLSTAITSVFFLGCILMVLGFVVVLFLREIPLRKSHTAPVAETPTLGTNRSRALLGLTLALVAREAQKPDANPQILESLSNTVNGRYPHDWSDEQRGKAVAQEIIEPLSITLLASSIGNGEGHNHEASSVSSAKTAPDANGMPSTDNFIGL